MNPVEGKWGITISGMYTKYLEKHKNNKDIVVDYKTYASIIKEFNSHLSDGLIKEALEFKMPYRLGKVRVKKFKQNIKIKENGEIYKRTMPVNWKKTKALWKDQYPDMSPEQIKKIPNKQVIYHLNEHTAGYRCTLHWDRINSNVVNNRVYSIMFTFSNRRKLAHILQTDCKINYYE